MAWECISQQVAGSCSEAVNFHGEKNRPIFTVKIGRFINPVVFLLLGQLQEL